MEMYDSLACKLQVCSSAYVLKQLIVVTSAKQYKEGYESPLTQVCEK